MSTRSHTSNHGFLTEMEAKEAAMNGATVRFRRYPPYLLCPLCHGDGSNMRPYLMGCGPHEPGWEIVEEESVA